MISIDQALAQRKRADAQDNRRVAAQVSLRSHRERLLEQARSLDREANELDRTASNATAARKNGRRDDPATESFGRPKQNVGTSGEGSR
jgi:hypothetical protein